MSAAATATAAAAATVTKITSTMPVAEQRRVAAAMAVLTGESVPRFMVEIVQDDEPSNPREWDNLGTMACWHKRYDLGDKHKFSEPADLLRELVDKNVSTGELVDFIKSGQAKGLRFEERGADGENSKKTIALMGYWDFAKKWGDEYEAPAPLDEGQWELRDKILDAMGLDDLRKFSEQSHVIMPLYLYDHSLLSMSTGTFVGRAQHAEWDSGQVGWAYVSHKRIAEEYGDASPESLEKARGCLQAEAETYDHYLRGDCYGFRLYEYGSEVDSCYGFLGSFEDAKAAISDYLPDKAAVAVSGMDYSNPVAEYDDEENESEDYNEDEHYFEDGEQDDSEWDDEDDNERDEDDEDELEGDF